LGVGPAGGAGVLKLDGGFAGGFVVGEGAIELGKDFVGGFDGEEGETVYVVNLKAIGRIKCTNNFPGLRVAHCTKQLYYLRSIHRCSRMSNNAGEAMYAAGKEGAHSFDSYPLPKIL
jgi:hypothetical protein